AVLLVLPPARADDGPVPVPAGARVSLVLDKPQYFLGENILVHFCVENVGAEAFTVETGGDYRGASRHLRFPATATNTAANPAFPPTGRTPRRQGRPRPPPVRFLLRRAQRPPHGGAGQEVLGVAAADPLLPVRKAGDVHPARLPRPRLEGDGRPEDPRRRGDDQAGDARPGAGREDRRGDVPADGGREQQPR